MHITTLPYYLLYIVMFHIDDCLKSGRSSYWLELSGRAMDCSFSIVEKGSLHRSVVQIRLIASFFIRCCVLLLLLLLLLILILLLLSTTIIFFHLCNRNLSDILNSDTDGRYNEQAFRLNALNLHRQNIICLIEGNIES